MGAVKKYDEHRHAAALENIAFLRAGGMSDEAIARRLGLTISAFQKKMERDMQQGRSGSERTGQDK